MDGRIEQLIEQGKSEILARQAEEARRAALMDREERDRIDRDWAPHLKSLEGKLPGWAMAYVEKPDQPPRGIYRLHIDIPELNIIVADFGGPDVIFLVKTKRKIVQYDDGHFGIEYDWFRQTEAKTFAEAVAIASDAYTQLRALEDELKTVIAAYEARLQSESEGETGIDFEEMRRMVKGDQDSVMEAIGYALIEIAANLREMTANSRE